MVATGEVASIKRSRKTKETTLTIEGLEATFLFRIDGDSSWQAPLAEVIIDGHASLGEPSEALTERVNGFIESYCEHAFTDPLDSLSTAVRNRLAVLQLAVGALDPPSTTTRDGVTYLNAPLGKGPVVHNQLRTTTDGRTKSEIATRILPAVKAWAQACAGSLPFTGLRFTAVMTNRDFAVYPPEPAHESLEVRVPLDAARAYARETLDARALLDAATVLVNGEQTSVQLPGS